MILKSIEDTKKIAQSLANEIINKKVIFLYGKIGVGKTTFVRGLINNLELEKGVNKSQILSPTFNIVFDYKIKNLKIMHYDLFRLKNSRDVEELGIFDEIKDHIILIEWPEIIQKKPQSRIEIFFNYFGENLEKRHIKIRGYGKWSNYEFE